MYQRRLRLVYHAIRRGYRATGANDGSHLTPYLRAPCNIDARADLRTGAYVAMVTRAFYMSVKLASKMRAPVTRSINNRNSTSLQHRRRTASRITKRTLPPLL